MSDVNSFAARGFDWRLFAGEEVIEDRLKELVIRSGAKRPFVICSKSISSKTRNIERIKGALGDSFAGYFDGIEIDSTYNSVVAATEAAKEAGADLLISVGGGSVIVATRVIDIFLCEDGDPFEIMTQYPEGKPAYSPRLNAPKLPIINVITTPTGAMNRGGSGLANPDLDQRMEYFDPKTRPIGLIFDHEAILDSPYELFRSTATTGFAGSVAAVAIPSNPLVEGDKEHILRLMKRGYVGIYENPNDIGPRMDLCVAALLGNRVQDDGEQVRGRQNPATQAFSGNYAISTALHIRYPHVWQGESTSVLTATVARRSPAPDIESARRVAQAMDVWADNMSAEDAKLAIADGIEDLYKKVGMPTRISELNIPKEDFSEIAKETIKVFNFNAGLRDADQALQDAIDLMEAAW